MKLTLTVLFCTCLGMSVFAQTSDAEAEAIINLLGVQKKEIVAQLVNVSGKDSVAFWKIYNDYEQKVKSTSKSRIQLYERTVRAYNNLTPATADSLATQYFKNRESQEAVVQSYYAKIKTATNAAVAFQFYQAEIYLLTQIRASIMVQIPTYGQYQAIVKSTKQ